MVHQVLLFIDGYHFGLAIKCADGWYKFEYAAGGASGVSGHSGHFGSSGSGGYSGKTSNKVTIKRSAPTGTVIHIGDTKRGLSEIEAYARKECGFDGSDYGITDNNCRIFCSVLADFMGVHVGYRKAAKDYWFAI